MPPTGNRPPLSEAQVEIMNLFWEHKTCSVADVWKILNARRGISRNTVHTMIIRLEEKGWLRRKVSGNSVEFIPTVTQKKAQQQTLRRLLDTVFSGSIEGMILTLLNDPTVSQEDADKIRSLIDQAKGDDQ